MLLSTSASYGNEGLAMSARGHAFGIDIGGSGVKGAAVDLATGELLHERIKIATPRPSTPQAVAEAVAKLVAEAEWSGPVGLTVPAVVLGGVVRTAANIDKGWIGTDARALFSGALGGREVTVLNDADAAGLAEDRYGAAKDFDGLVLLLTFGTGIGSALIHNGTLVPNSELGHLEVGGMETEHRAAASIKDRDGLSYPQWAAAVSTVLIGLENLFWPKVIVAGGGISRDADQWIPLLGNRTPVVPAHLRNTAGIVGAAMAIDSGLAP
ncbi:polyphosphate--glucose phosphotransferase [Microbacterium aurum]